MAKKSFTEELAEAPEEYVRTYKTGLGLDPDKDYVEEAKEKVKKFGNEVLEGAKEYGKTYKKGLGMKKGGKVSKASSRADGIAQRGKTKGRIC